MNNKILILTSATGGGHNQAAEATKMILEDDNTDIYIYDFFKSDKFMNTFIVDGYEIYANKLSAFYGWFYKISDHKYIIKLTEFFFHFVRKKLLNYINELKPNLIVATHPLAINILCYLKRKNQIHIPVISIVTDFKAHYTYIGQEIDLYVVASDCTKESLEERGISSEKIKILGIPVKRQFFLASEEVSVTLDNSKGLSILLMGGGMGLDNISSVLEQIVKNKNHLNIIVVCGNNDKLKDHLLSLYGKEYNNKSLSIMGYTQDVYNLMKQCDILISKPGGLTTSEAIIAHIPLLIPFTIPGQEIDNKDFLLEKNCAIYVDNVKAINTEIDKLIDNPEVLEDMKNNMKTLSSFYCADKLHDLCMGLIQRNC